MIHLLLCTYVGELLESCYNNCGFVDLTIIVYMLKAVSCVMEWSCNCKHPLVQSLNFIFKIHVCNLAILDKQNV